MDSLQWLTNTCRSIKISSSLSIYIYIYIYIYMSVCAYVCAGEHDTGRYYRLLMMRTFKPWSWWKAAKPATNPATSFHTGSWSRLKIWSTKSKKARFSMTIWLKTVHRLVVHHHMQNRNRMKVGCWWKFKIDTLTWSAGSRLRCGHHHPFEVATRPRPEFQRPQFELEMGREEIQEINQQGKRMTNQVGRQTHTHTHGGKKC